MMALVGVMMGGCPGAPTPAPHDRDGAGTELGETCSALRALGCPEGQPVRPDETCYEHLMNVNRRTLIPSVCVRKAPTREVLRGCGDASTLRFRCGAE